MGYAPFGMRLNIVGDAVMILLLPSIIKVNFKWFLVFFIICGNFQNFFIYLTI